MTEPEAIAILQQGGPDTPAALAYLVEQYRGLIAHLAARHPDRQARRDLVDEAPRIVWEMAQRYTPGGPGLAAYVSNHVRWEVCRYYERNRNKVGTPDERKQLRVSVPVEDVAFRLLAPEPEEMPHDATLLPRVRPKLTRAEARTLDAYLAAGSQLLAARRLRLNRSTVHARLQSIGAKVRRLASRSSLLPPDETGEG